MMIGAAASQKETKYVDPTQLIWSSFLVQEHQPDRWSTFFHLQEDGVSDTGGVNDAKYLLHVVLHGLIQVLKDVR